MICHVSWLVPLPWLEAHPLEPPPPGVAIALEAPPLHVFGEDFLIAGKLACLLRIGAPCPKQGCVALRLVGVAWINLALLFEPLPEHVLRVEVVLGCFRHALWPDEFVGMPVKT